MGGIMKNIYNDKPKPYKPKPIEDDEQHYGN
jgi:hypothetical protein